VVRGKVLGEAVMAAAAAAMAVATAATSM